MKIFLLIPSGLTLPLNNAETIEDIKTLIKFITGTSTARLRFVCAGRILDHDASLADQKIRDGSTIYVCEVGFQIFVRNLSGKTITIDNVHSYDTIDHVMNKIEKKDRMPSWYHLLVHAGKQLQQEMTLADYGIGKDSILFMVSRLRSYSGMEESFHGLCVFGELTLGVKTSDTIDIVKRKIMVKYDLPRQPDRLLLSFNGNVLVDQTSTLMDNDVYIGAVLNLALAPPPWVRKRKRGSNEEEDEDAKKGGKKIHLLCEIDEEILRRLEEEEEIAYGLRRNSKRSPCSSRIR